MVEFIRLHHFLLLALAGAAVTFIGSAVAWWMDVDQRRHAPMVRKVLGGSPDGVIVASEQRAAAGFRLAGGQVVVMQNGGADALLYRLHAWWAP